MLRRRHGELYCFTQRSIIDQWSEVPICNHVFHHGIRFDGPVKSRILILPVEHTEIVDHVATADDQDTFLAEG